MEIQKVSSNNKENKLETLSRRRSLIKLKARRSIMDDFSYFGPKKRKESSISSIKYGFLPSARAN
jgi:hypothetical protein